MARAQEQCTLRLFALYRVLATDNETRLVVRSTTPLSDRADPLQGCTRPLQVGPMPHLGACGG